MKDHWKRLLAGLDYKPGETIVDIGGAMDPVPIADAVIDLISPTVEVGTFFQVDITSQPLPFSDKLFDICVCSQTLEDLTSPMLVLGEMQRIAKRGVIEVPHRGIESLKNMHYNGYSKPHYAMPEVWHFGTGHHKWLIEQYGDDMLLFTPKIQYMLMRHPIPKWNGPGGITFYWKDSFQYGLLYDIDEQTVDENFKSFRERNRQYWE